MNVPHGFDAVADAVRDAVAITRDNCNTILVLMDDTQLQLFRQCGYEPIITAQEASPEAMLRTIHRWYVKANGMNLIRAVWTHTDDHDLGYRDLVPQFARRHDRVVPG